MGNCGMMSGGSASSQDVFEVENPFREIYRIIDGPKLVQKYQCSPRGLYIASQVKGLV
jgi:hypothetical protein